MYRLHTPKVKLFETKTLLDDLNQEHKLVIIARSIDWAQLESDLSIYYDPDLGRTAYPIRRMAGLLILQSIENLSDEKLIDQCMENKYYQAFLGYDREKYDVPPCNPATLVKFRHRIGEEGCKRILQESVKINGEEALKAVEEPIIVDSTAQEKNITFPTDIKLAISVILILWRISRKLRIVLRNKHKKEVFKLRKDAAFDKSNKKTEIREEILIRLREIGLELLRELKRKVPQYLHKDEKFIYFMEVYHKALTQKKDDHDKIYSVYEPQIYCIVKGKENKKYEFGTKVVVATGSKNNIIYSIQSLDTNLHDVKTIDLVVNDLKDLYDVKPQTIIGDKGYRGYKGVNNELKVVIPPKNMDSIDQRERKNLIGMLNRRSSIEQTISHLKNDYRLGRNMLRGRIGDKINPILAGIGYNFSLFARNEINKIKEDKLKSINYKKRVKNPKPIYQETLFTDKNGKQVLKLSLDRKLTF